MAADPSPSARSGAGLPVAILVHEEQPNTSGSSTATSYSILLVAADGSVVAKANPHLPSAVVMTYNNCPVIGRSPMPTCQIPFRPRAPLVTSSDTRAYFLDGDSDVGYLTPDGRTGTAVHLPVGPRLRYAVAVSPDDSRIAVTAFDYRGSSIYGNPGVTMNLFVQDLAGGHRVDLFSSSSVTEWPIGWHNGHLVIAVGPAGIVQYTADNPYFAVEGYHLANANTGVRIATVGTGDECTRGPVVRAGAACWLNAFTVLGYRSWDGVAHPFAPVVGFNPGGLSPNGSQVAGSGGATGGAANWHLALISGSGVNVLNVNGVAQGWLDDEHLVYFTASSSKTSILKVATGLSTAVSVETPKPLPGLGLPYLQFLGTVPQQIS